MKRIYDDEMFAKKIGEALSEFYTKYSSAKKNGKLELLREKFSEQIKLVLEDYHNKIRHER